MSTTARVLIASAWLFYASTSACTPRARVADELPRVEPRRAPSARRPRILVAATSPSFGIDRRYLAELAEHGFDMDFTETVEEIDHDRLRRFDAVVLFATPDAYAVHTNRPALGRDAAFARLLDDYARSGGGVLLMPEETNERMQRLSALTDLWGAKLPAERIVERDASKRAAIPRGSFHVPLAFTDQIVPSPITEGIRGLWYPLMSAYSASTTMPLVVDDDWQVVVRASTSAETERVDLASVANPVPGLLQRSSPERSPAIMAIRGVGEGRVALLALWPQFSFISGTKWLFDRIVLSRGPDARRSDLGRLLENTLRWLSEPKRSRPPDVASFASRLSVPTNNRSAQVREQLGERALTEIPDAEKLLPAGARVMAGLIGARTPLSGGRSTVEAYAAAAKRAGLRFVVFLEDFAQMTPDKLEALTRDCERLSSADLLLLPGYTGRTNLQNRMFFFGPHPSWPPPSALTGLGQHVLYAQARDDGAGFTGYGTTLSNWIHDAFHNTAQQVGYFDFRSAPHGVRLFDARMYSMAGVMHFVGGAQREDRTADYLRAARTGIAPTPVAIHEVSSAAELERVARARRGLTYVVASTLDMQSRDGVWARGLRWQGPTDAMSTFVSSGPDIVSWAGSMGAFRSYTYGAEGFAPARSVMLAPLIVEAARGLRTISIYDGEQLFRRLRFSGERRYAQTLVLPGNLSMNLVLVAEDRAGGIAVSYPRRSWGDGAQAPVFCSDHVNDCRHMLLAHGPYNFPIAESPRIPTEIAGATWDGGPFPDVSPLGLQSAATVVHSAAASYDSWRLAPTARLDFADEGATGVSMLRDVAYEDSLAKILNPWHTQGPLSRRPVPIAFAHEYRVWLMSSRGVTDEDWVGNGSGRDQTATLLTGSARFRQSMSVQRATFARFQRVGGTTLTFLGSSGESTPVVLDTVQSREIPLAKGHGMSVHGSSEANAYLFVNNGPDLTVSIATDSVAFVDTQSRRVERGDTASFSLSAFGFSVADARSQAERASAFFRRLSDDATLDLLRGTRDRLPGLFQLAIVDGAVEVRMPKQGDARLLPLRVRELNPRWSAGLLQKQGYTAGFYGTGRDRYRALAVDRHGDAYVPLDVGDSDLHLLAGHPLVADARGDALFIQVTCLGGAPMRWHVSLNNPTSGTIVTELKSAMSLPGFNFPPRQVRVPPGGVVQLAVSGR